MFGFYAIFWRWHGKKTSLTPAQYVQSGLGAFLLTSDQLGVQNNSVCFRPLDPPLLVEYALVWKRYAVMSKPAAAFLSSIQKS